MRDVLASLAEKNRTSYVIRDIRKRKREREREGREGEREREREGVARGKRESGSRSRPRFQRGITFGVYSVEG